MDARQWWENVSQVFLSLLAWFSRFACDCFDDLLIVKPVGVCGCLCVCVGECGQECFFFSIIMLTREWEVGGEGNYCTDFVRFCARVPPPCYGSLEERFGRYDSVVSGLIADVTHHYAWSAENTGGAL